MAVNLDRPLPQCNSPNAVAYTRRANDMPQVHYGTVRTRSHRHRVVVTGRRDPFDHRACSRSGVEEFGRGVPQPCFTIRIVRERLYVALLVFDDECAVSQVRPAVVEDE